MTQNVTIVNSNTDIYASQVGYLFSPARFRYRAFDQKYNEVYLNGLLLNDMESGQFHAAKEIDCKVTHFYSIKEMFPNFIYINIVFQCCDTQKGRNVLYFNAKKA